MYQPDVRQVRSAEVRPAEVHPGEVRIEEVRPEEIRLAEVRIGEVGLCISIFLPPLIPGIYSVLNDFKLFFVCHV